MKCNYCDPEKQTPWYNNRKNMCPECREGYFCYLEEKADEERVEILINEKLKQEGREKIERSKE